MITFDCKFGTIEEGRWKQSGHPWEEFDAHPSVPYAEPAPLAAVIFTPCERPSGMNSEERCVNHT